jgi:hypothetical protein
LTALAPMAVPTPDTGDTGPVFHGLFRTSERREAVAPVVSALWGSHAVSAPSPGGARPKDANPNGRGLDLFRDGA